jgi:hypothetical protein
MLLTTVDRARKGTAFYSFDAGFQFEEFFLEGG